MKKILFVEDEEALQRTMGDILEREKYEVIKALNGEDGLRLAKSEKPDLIILDIVLPRMKGFEVLQELKEEEETKDIPVIILTNLEKPKDVEKALDLGATTYLVKTHYALEEVIDKIKKIFKE